MKKILLLMMTLCLFAAIYGCGTGDIPKSDFPPESGSSDTGSEEEEEVVDISLETPSVTIFAEDAEGCDFTGLFKLTVNGAEKKITADMIYTDVKSVPGTYGYTISYKEESRTLTVNVIKKEEENKAEVILSYDNYILPVDKIESFDFTSLFSIYVGKKAYKVTPDMIDANSLKGAAPGDCRTVYLSCEIDGKSVSAEAKVTVKEKGRTVINAKNAETYPGGSYIDPTALFEITKDGENIPVTLDMISGTVDYTVPGENSLTLSYDGETAAAVVNVLSGVVISCPKGDRVTVVKGTDMETYPFEEDFSLVINGVKFTDFAGHIDLSGVDFDTEGSYEATLNIDYNCKPVGLHGAKFDRYSKTVTYVVTAVSYEVSLKEETVSLKIGEKYKETDNLKVVINGIVQKLTDRKDYVSPMACYAEVVNPVDPFVYGTREVKVLVYVNGPGEEPVEACYDAEIKSGAEITGNDIALFNGATLYSSDLFKVTEDGRDVSGGLKVCGKADTFNVGVYTLTAKYKDAEKSVKAAVLGEELKGVYKSPLTTFDDGFSTSSDEDYPEEPFVKEELDDVYITNSDGRVEIKTGGNALEIVSVTGLGNLTVRIGRTLYKLKYNDGFLVFVPENKIKIRYTNSLRPMVYYHTGLWELKEHITVNSGSGYVLESEYPCFSADIFRFSDKRTGNVRDFVLKTELAEKSDSDYYYNVTFSDIFLPDDYINRFAAESYFVCGGERYDFKITGDNVGKILKPGDGGYGDKTYRGKHGGIDAVLTLSKGAAGLSAGGRQIFHATSLDVGSMTAGGIDGKSGTAFFYRAHVKDDEFYSYKFLLNKDDCTFTEVESDGLKGLYVHDKAFIFLDGYGGGYLNLDSKSYIKTDFMYERKGNIVDIEYKNALPSFKYGKGAMLFADEFSNILTARNFKGACEEGARFENVRISEGLLVSFGNLTIGKGNSTVIKPRFLDSVKIFDKDGEVSPDKKKSMIDLKTVNFGEPGFYRFSVKADIGGKPAEKICTLHVLDDIFKDSGIAGVYGEGVFYSNSFAADEYGRITVCLEGGKIFSGMIRDFKDGKFGAALYSDDLQKASFKGELLCSGTVKAELRGDISFTDYYTVGQTGVSGSGNTVLRYFSHDGDTVFILSEAAKIAGEKAEVKAEEGDILSAGAVISVTNSDGSVFKARILSWNDAANGLEIIQ